MSNRDDDDTKGLLSGHNDFALLERLVKLTKFIQDHDLEWCDESEAWLSEDWILRVCGDDPWLESRSDPNVIKSFVLKENDADCGD